MPNQDWTPAIGLRNATISLVWRSLVAAALWFGLLWVFHASLSGIGVTRVPMLIATGFALVAGTLTGMVLSRGMAETAGFVSPLLTLLVLVFAAAAIMGAEMVFERMFSTSTDHLRSMIVGATMIIAAVWIVRHTLLDL